MTARAASASGPRRGLILVPTELERAALEGALPSQVPVRLCGFGPIAAGIATARLLDELRPAWVILVGIAGRYGTAAPASPPLGSACVFSRVTQYGVGVGSGPAYRSAGELGWQAASAEGQDDADTLPLQTSVFTDNPALADRVPFAGRLLSVCSGAADLQDREHRLARYPDAVAEDMEGYAVALACHTAGVERCIVRGFSNDVGDRNKSHWQIQPALTAAARLTRRLVGAED
ncbi:futalosine hydrolase [Roseimaritima sediminicola]|uniref:futalosine hydrolase n=1 Tax=Roseimaritima sediminicola TaxID=2662066 RepID=UPI0012982470|nr:futalosine hydrolase [Roseimaritima sediminicola]